MALFDILANKTTEELKLYVTDDGYTAEAVETAKSILRERKVDVDELLRIKQEKSDKDKTAEDHKSHDKDTKLGGWIIFFLWSIFAGSIRTLISEINNINPDDYFNSKLLITFSVLEFINYILLAAYTIFSVWKRKPNAVFLCKLTSIYLFSSNLITLVSGDLDYNATRIHFISFAWSIVWLLYFIFSKHVNQIFPKENRKVYLRDKLFIAWMILTVFMGVGTTVYMSLNWTSIEIQESSLAPNEYTDGVIAFTLPEGYSCEMLNPDESSLFEVSNEDHVILILGAVDRNHSEAHADEYFLVLQHDNIIVNWSENLVLEDVEKRGMLTIYHRTFIYADPDEQYSNIVFDIFVVFDKETGKVALMRDGFLLGCVNSQINDILNSLRFQ